MPGKNLFSLIPKVDELIENDRIIELMGNIPRKIVMDSIRDEIEDLRENIKSGNLNKDEIIEINKKMQYKVIERAREKNRFNLRRVVNATGVVIHTNLGRSLINEKAMENISEIALNYSNLEYNLGTGKRGSRYSHLEDVIAKITGAESAMVVNNNAAAVLLVLSTLAKDREVVVSRGELIEIGGSFRIPDVMEQSGARLVEVGTTNKTHLWDFENAIGEGTAALLKVHTSNYRIMGFTSNVDSSELYSLKEKYGLPLVEDLGSGVLVDLSKYGIEYEPTVQDSLEKGVDIVTFSGDKLLGGPQAGIIVGKKEYIEKMKKNPFTRAFRVDKFTISALEATLKYYLDEELVENEIPTLKMLSAQLPELQGKAAKLKEMLQGEIDYKGISLEIEDDYSQVGGGSLPTEKLPTKCVVISLENDSTQAFESELRKYKTPIITRFYKDKLYLDVRTVREEEFPIVINGVIFALNNIKGAC